MKFHIICLWVTFAFSSLLAQDSSKYIILPKGHVFQPIYLDPTECQSYGGFFDTWDRGDQFKDYKFRWQFSFGFQKALIKKQVSAEKQWDWAIEVAALTQFGLTKNLLAKLGNNTKNTSTYESDILNTDYRIGFPLSYKLGDYGIRFNVFHTSTHLGNEYMVIHHIFYFIPDPGNFEQAEALVSRTIGKFRYYGGSGIVISPGGVRKRISFQLGFQFTKPTSNPRFRWVGGTDIKIWQQNNFLPAINAGAGFEFGKQDDGIKMLATYYYGNIPYSIYTNILLQWVAVGFYFNPS